MTVYRFVPQLGFNDASWSYPDFWSTKSVPDSIDAQVVIDPDTNQPPAGLSYTTQVDIDQGQSFQAGNLQLGSGMTLSINGSLAVLGAADLDGSLDLSGGSLIAGSVTLNNPAADLEFSLGSSGTIASTGRVDNEGMLVGDGLTVTGSSLKNSGALIANSGNLTVDISSGGFQNLVQGTLTGGTIESLGGTLLLNVGGPIISDNANIILGGGDIKIVSASTGVETPIEQTLQSIALGGVLSVNGDYAFGSLTNQGTVDLAGSLLFTGLTNEVGGQINVGFPAEAPQNSMLDGPTVNDGVIDVAEPLGGVADPSTGQNGVLVVSGDVAGSGSIVLAAGPILLMENVGFVQASPSLELLGADQNSVEFGSAQGDLTLGEPTKFGGTLVGFSGPDTFVADTPDGPEKVNDPGDEIILHGVARSDITSDIYTGSAAGGTLVIDDNGKTVKLNFAGDYDTGSFILTPDSNDTILTDATVACFTRGTLISTSDGECAVELIEEGALLRLWNGELSPVCWVGRRRTHCAGHPRPETLYPVRIRAGAIGHQIPRRDLMVSPDHAVYIDGVLIPAGLLVNGSTIVREPCSVVEYFHLELPKHEIVCAEGAPAESYLDTGNRGQFANAPLQILPIPLGHRCCELTLEGPKLQAMRLKLGQFQSQKAA